MRVAGTGTAQGESPWDVNSVEPEDLLCGFPIVLAFRLAAPGPPTSLGN